MRCVPGCSYAHGTVSIFDALRASRRQRACGGASTEMRSTSSPPATSIIRKFPTHRGTGTQADEVALWLKPIVLEAAMARESNDALADLANVYLGGFLCMSPNMF